METYLDGPSRVLDFICLTQNGGVFSRRPASPMPFLVQKHKDDQPQKLTRPKLDLLPSHPLRLIAGGRTEAASLTHWQALRKEFG